MEEFPDRKIFASDSPVRRCTKCRKILTRDKFYKNRSTLSGLDNWCRLCRSKNTKGNRSRFVSSYRFVNDAKIKIGRGNLACVCCGNKNFQWLHIDHIVPIKTVISKRSRKGESTQQISREIMQGKRADSEYQLLCANCNFAKRDKEKCPIDHSLD